jgi:hypothetical protein
VITDNGRAAPASSIVTSIALLRQTDHGWRFVRCRQLADPPRPKKLPFADGRLLAMPAS